MFKTQVIVNPASARGRTRKRWSEIRAVLKNWIREFKYDFTEKPFQATEIARQAVKEGTELVIGVGGDGTIHEIANGFFEGHQLINPEATIAIVPSGTGCDLTKSLNIPQDLNRAVRTITEAPSLPMDVGKVTFTNETGQSGERYFLNVADFGLGGEVVKKVNERRLRRKASSYVRCLISTMIEYRARKIRVKIDGQEVAENEYLIGAIANGKIFGKGMKIAPLARLEDGLFDTILIKSMNFLEFCLNGWRLINGSHISYRKVSYLKGSTIEASPLLAMEPVLLEMDGEQIGRLPAKFEILSRRLRVKGYLDKET